MTTLEQLHQLQQADYSYLLLSEMTEASAARVQSTAENICGVDWNHRSNALRREVLYVLECAVADLGARFYVVDYLEIGSAYGVSLSAVALLLSGAGVLGRIVSIDPYVPYTEGARGIHGEDVHIEMNEGVERKARTLYNELGLVVELIRAESDVGLRRLANEGRLFHLIYIDGRHEGFTPMRDLASSLELLYPGGVVMLDEPHWPDVAPLVTLCERNCHLLVGCWKTMAFRVAE